MKHLSHKTLLLLLDDELSEHDATAARHHVDACAACRERCRALASVMQGELLPDACSDPQASHAALAQRLRMASPARPSKWWRPRLLWQAAAVVLLLGTGFAFRRMYVPLQDSMAAYEETGPEPNRALTPGAVRSVALVELCTMADDTLDPAVSAEKAQAVFQAYGLSQSQARGYQVDYLINPQLGGSDSLDNLWPEPYHATVWNAVAKDALEARLHGLVCSGQIELKDAQRQLAADWIGSYKRIFHSTRPVRIQAANRL